MDKLQKAYESGQLVIVAGAGISKDPPSSLPSWWDYNILLLELIGETGAKAVGYTENLLNLDAIRKIIPVTNVSDFFVNRIAGSSYFPLLELLDGATPNCHHYLLAELAKEGHLAGIVTTNFDTLIEKAFEEKGVPFSLYASEEDYLEKCSDDGIPVHKIHGSADKALAAIDTTQQKLIGFSSEKRDALRKLFENNHVLFMGFSGEDFLFGTDYIPIRVNKKRGMGVTWIAYPGSSFNVNTQRLIKELRIHVFTGTLPDFYESQNWNPPLVNLNGMDRRPFRSIAAEKIEALLKKIGGWACAGLSLQLLDSIDLADEAEKVYKIVKKALGSPVISMSMLSLYSALSQHAQIQGNIEEALKYISYQKEIFKKEEELYQYYPMKRKNPPAFYEQMLNHSTVENRFGQILLYENSASPETGDVIKNAFWLSYKAMSWENMAVAMRNLSLWYMNVWEAGKTEQLLIDNNFIGLMQAAENMAKRGGRAELVFDINCNLSIIYLKFAQVKYSRQALERAKEILPLCMDKQTCAVGISEIEEDIGKIDETLFKDRLWEQERVPIFSGYKEALIWDPYGERPVLAFEEGQFAKKLYGAKPNGKLWALDYIREKLDCFIQQNRLEEADAFSNLLAGFAAEEANRYSEYGLRDIWEAKLEQAKKYYELCLQLECGLGRYDYLMGTLGSLSAINVLKNNEEHQRLALFQAELCMCFSTDPKECWQVVKAAETACLISRRRNMRVTALEYCKKYLKMVEEAPWAADSLNVERMKKVELELEG